MPKLEEALLNFKRDMERYNVIILDLNGWNILVDRETFKVWVIDGYGPTEFIPLPKYFHIFGTAKIRRLWKRVFLKRYARMLTNSSIKTGYWKESRLISEPCKDF